METFIEKNKIIVENIDNKKQEKPEKDFNKDYFQIKKAEKVKKIIKMNDSKLLIIATNGMLLYKNFDLISFLKLEIVQYIILKK